MSRAPNKQSDIPRHPGATRLALELAILRGIELLDAMGDDADLEGECEDEGAQCEDEGSYRDGDDEPDDSGIALTYPDAHDQRTPWPGCGINRVDGYGTAVALDDDPGDFSPRVEWKLAR